MTLRNEAGDDVAKGVCHSVDADDVVDIVEWVILKVLKIGF